MYNFICYNTECEEYGDVDDNNCNIIARDINLKEYCKKWKDKPVKEKIDIINLDRAIKLPDKTRLREIESKLNQLIDIENEREA
jgi:hypothetical protein